MYRDTDIEVLAPASAKLVLSCLVFKATVPKPNHPQHLHMQTKTGFIMYINDLSDVCKHFANVYLFADDAK